MTTLDKATPGADGQPVPTAAPHDPTTAFYAVGGSDPDFALPPRGEAHVPGFWTRLIPSARRR